MGAGHHGLPVGTLIQFTIADNNVGTPVLLLIPCAQGHTHSDGKTVTERAGGGLNIGTILPVAVHAKFRFVENLEMLDHVILGVGAQVGKNCVKGLAAVTFGENQTIPVFPARVLDVVVHVLVIEGHCHLHDGKLAAKMPHADAIDKVQQIAPDVIGLGLQSLNGFYIHISSCLSFMLQICQVVVATN